MAAPPDIPSLHSAVTSALLSTTRTVNELCAEDLDFHRSLDPQLGRNLDRQNARLLGLVERLINNATADLTSNTAGSGKGKGKGGDLKLTQDLGGEGTVAEAIEGNWGRVVDIVDALLEKADASLDEFTGVVKRGKLQSILEPDKPQQTVPKKKKSSPYDFFKTHNIPKPQLRFQIPPANNETTPFKPLLTMKPHAIVPLEESLRLQSSVDEDSQEQQQQYDTNIFFSSSPLQPEGQPEPESEEPSDPSSEEAKKAAKRASRQRSKLRKKKLKFADSYAHPYAPEINAYTYPAAVHTSSPPIPPTDFDKNPATFVDTTEGLHAMVQELKGAAAIAVDLEHHDYRTYVGITSLMQISTREKDFVIDTLKPWRRQLEVLNEIFANPAILKVFHGSTMDMIWLQRDLGLYIVGLFDTFHACRALGYPRAGLDYLLQKFVNFEAQKQYQKADWRIRPLPSELFDYARSDTHFLLYVYDNMRNELISRSTPDNDLLQYVLENSKVESLQRYEHFFYDSESGNGQLGWRKALLNTSAMFDKQQFAVFRALHAWRDEVARQEDDSTGFIIPQHGLFAVARAMPTETGNLFATLPGMSLPVRMRSNELVAVIAKAKEDGKDGPELNEVLGVLGKRKREGEESGPLTAKNQEMPRTKEAPKIVEAPPLENVRATTSNFWGPAFSAGGARNSIKFTAKAATNRLRLALPLPNLTAQVYADPAEVAAATSKTNEHMNPGARAEHAYVTSKGRAKTPVDDDVFVVQQLGGKRKRPHYEDQSLLQPMEGNFDPAADQLAVDEDELDWMQEKQLRQREHAQREEYNKQKKAEQEQLRAEKKEKRAEKRRKKSGQNGLPSDGTVPSLDGSGGLPYDEETPFDYSTAPSVLHARDAVDVTGGRKGKKGGGFDPYKKALDAPKGLGKRQKDNRGRSGTFAN